MEGCGEWLELPTGGPFEDKSCERVDGFPTFKHGRSSYWVCYRTETVTLTERWVGPHGKSQRPSYEGKHLIRANYLGTSASDIPQNCISGKEAPSYCLFRHTEHRFGYLLTYPPTIIGRRRLFPSRQ